MSTLGKFLQHAFQEYCPSGWRSATEVPLLDKKKESLLGYSPKADVLLSKLDGDLRLWIEFEISRADPVANHAKFATAHIFFPWQETDVFLSMVTSHVARGRNNLAANTIWLMRKVGLHAYQTGLLPHYSPQEIYRLNYIPLENLALENLPIKTEIERVFLVTKSISNAANRTLYYVANLMEVLLNVAQWNHDVMDPSIAELWGKRRITYFIYNPFTKDYAPSKFCAYVAIESLNTKEKQQLSGATMTIPLYVQIPWETPIFDGYAARRHLENHLAMRTIKLLDSPDLLFHFERWLNLHQECFHVTVKDTYIIMPPQWY